MILRKRTEELNNARAAFTLMEMLVVVAIIVALAGLGGYYVMGQLQSSQKKTAKLKAIEIAKACENYMIDHQNQAPPSLDVLFNTDAQGNGPYMKKTADALTDPWGNPFHYDPNGQQQQNGLSAPHVWSAGPRGGDSLGNY